MLSRELTIDEIKEIRSKVRINEVFVHGSICISYSGKCYISSFLTSRSANRGECTNSCRWNYTLMEEKGRESTSLYLRMTGGLYIMSSKDLCMIGDLHLLSDAGIDSFKIEGKDEGHKLCCRCCKDLQGSSRFLGNGKYAVNPRWLKELSMFSSRGYTTGMFFGKQPR